MSSRKVPIVAALLALLGVLVLAGVATGAGREAGLDTSYGKDGVALLNPPGPEGEERGFNANSVALGFAAAGDGSAYVMAELENCGKTCQNGPYVARFDPSGKRDNGFGGSDGRLKLPTGFGDYTVGVDAAGRVLVAYSKGTKLVIRRFESDGSVDKSFGAGGTKKLHCGVCAGYAQVRWVSAPGGRRLFVADHVLSKGAGGTRFEAFRFLAGGGLDRSFGKAGKAIFDSPHRELAHAVVAAPNGAILIGGSKCCGARQIFLERVGPTGRPDKAFDRVAAGSVRRLTSLGEFPTLTAVIPTAGGGLAALGTSENRHGFELRLRGDGHLDRGFGKRGLQRLPFLVDAAAPGAGGAIFAIGEAKPYARYHAFRLLANGRPDPAYKGAAGIRVPLSGYPARITPIAPGEMLVTDKGDYECIRECTPAEPGMARFLE
jgi:uncharacterized delta-60 repeat protein